MRRKIATLSSQSRLAGLTAQLVFRDLNKEKKMTNFKMAALGVLAVAGIASAAVAQQPQNQKPAANTQQHQQMMQGGMQNGHMMKMMADPEMKKMMESCHRMMEGMGNMSAPAKPKS